ncbi:hypothetical protein GUJ93_ZPchr0001g32230 [Zizania palustris]|uniref:Uncharacterized protein n=1 Tax=Zizania palustris TaxID=103762 RepID=A0A8J5VU95_ZIZPA|nr:hypothetical protein GUJ93_ZPchr0001g32230 [Zizania palustris]
MHTRVKVLPALGTSALTVDLPADEAGKSWTRSEDGAVEQGRHPCGRSRKRREKRGGARTRREEDDRSGALATGERGAERTRRSPQGDRWQAEKMGEIEKLVEKGDRREDAVLGGDDGRSAGGENSSKSPIIWDKGLDGGSAGVGLRG